MTLKKSTICFQSSITIVGDGKERHSDGGVLWVPLKFIGIYLLLGKENTAPSRKLAEGQRWVIVLRLV